MISLRNILNIAKYESKVLWRNWFFRIVSIIGTGFVLVFNIAVFSEANTPPWSVLSNSWIQPYALMVLMSITQAATVIFLATGLIKKDKKIDTNEVIFVRPLSNLDYVLGKALALFKLFFFLNIGLSIIPIIVNLTNPNSDLVLTGFVIYPLLTSLPSIVFLTGLSFLTVTLLKNQPVSIILLLGVSAVQLIYYFGEFSDILDFSAFRITMLASEMVGFVDLKFPLMQRLFYFCIGISFLFMTSVFYGRLNNHKTNTYISTFISLLFLAVSAYVMLSLWDMRQGSIDLREKIISVNDQWVEEPNVTIISNHISLESKGEELICTSSLGVKNNTEQSLSSLFFTLNPGLKVKQITLHGKPTEFERNLQIVSIKNVIIPKGAEASLIVEYSGSIMEEIAHLEVDQKRYEYSDGYFMFWPKKKYAFAQSDYLLLTKDVQWYPTTELGFSKKAPVKGNASFIDFELSVKSSNGLKPISQGALTVNDGEYHFKPEYPLPQISLAMGRYEKKNISVKDVEYTIYHYPRHDYFSKHFDHLSDTLSFLITDIINEYEDVHRLKYPFKRLQFVETPLHFSAYNKLYESQQAFVQPEMLFYPEEGGQDRAFDLRRRLRDMEDQARKKNTVMSDKEKQANVFSDMIKKQFTNMSGTRWVFGGSDVDEPNYSLFGNLLAYNSGVVSEKWSLFNKSIADYLLNNKQEEKDYSRNANGISFAEDCNRIMRESSLMDILTQDIKYSEIQKSVALKTEYLFSYLGQLLGDKELRSFLHDWINEHQHQLTNYSQFRAAFIEKFGTDIDPIIAKVYSDTSQPAFIIEDVQKYEVLDDTRKKFQVIMDIKNTGDNDGVIKVKFDYGDENKSEDFLAILKKGEAKQLGYILEQQPRNILVNTIVSRNIPSIITITAGKFIPNKEIELFEGERMKQKTEVTNHEYIVDNEDEGFTSFSPIKPTLLRSYLDGKNQSNKKYFGQWNRSYSKWLATTSSFFYGQSVRSAHFTRSGKGEKHVSWSPNIEEDGFYDVYTHLMGKNQKENNRVNNTRYTYHYIINHGDGSDEIVYDLSKAQPGWNYLGSYYFRKAEGNVMLTDESELRSIYADAIKWVKQ